MKINKTLNRVGQAPNKRKVFKKGEEVVVGHGGFISAKIIEVVQEGVYKLLLKYNKHITYTSNTVETEEEKVYGWWQIFKKSDENTNFSKKERIRISFFQQNIESALHKYFNEYSVNLNPYYQREIVWTKIQKDELLTSIFNNIDIGKFVFVYKKDVEDYGYDVLDGKQRLTTLIGFFTDCFKYKGKYFSELSFLDKYKFKSHPISVGEVREEMSEKDILEYFLKLNTSGTPMDKKHLNKIKEMCNEN